MTRDPHWAELFYSGSLIMLLGCGGQASFGTAGSSVNIGSGSGGGRGTLVSSGTGGGSTVGSTVIGGNVDPGASTGGALGTVVGAGSGGGTPTATPTPASDLPCAVASVLATNCATCHGAQPRFGAPMSLVTSADFKKMATSGSTTVGAAVISRIQDDAKPMPAPPANRLSASDISTLTTWINAGAKPATCQTAPAPVTGTGGGNGGSGATATAPPVDADTTCYDLVAHDPASKSKPFNVPATPDLYHCFNFSPPWGSDKVQMVNWSPIIDNDKVIHHWILYNDTGSVTDGSDMDCSGAHPTAAMVTGWAPGGQASSLPPDVGQSVAGLGFTLEIHYNNTLGTQSDASGVHMCVTKNLRKNEAGIHWLGTENIALPAGGSTSGLCAPKATTPVTIISATPHMHLQGRHMTTVINRKGGTTETLIDKPFEFANQIGYQTPAIIMPGDTLTTTCTYGGAAFYGQGTKQEMCYNFVLAYPNGGLSSGSLLRENGCTGL